MRLNEICQLHVKDIYQKDDIWVFDNNKNTPEKKLKNKVSKRLVPIHSRLLELGILDFVKSKKGDRVFDELNYHPFDGYGRAASRWFGRWRKNIGVEPPLHSARHTVVINHLKQKDVDWGV